ncbi:phospholipase A2 group XV-like [Nilaparvata lugens]|uniref:phospholipase A2 group XV-like n=1 Tax=Nilaparvata lugens TaxID=108931 RepID=UPI00193EB66C|nr:phospholipase A2 group XV-like [Nilaparvata lugens]
MMSYRIQVFLILLYTSKVFTDGLNPIILIPGYSGSQIEAKLNNKTNVPNFFCMEKSGEFFNIWGSIEVVFPLPFVDCLADNLRMVYDSKTHTTNPPPGVETRIPGFGDTAKIENVMPNKMSRGNYYHDLVEGLVNSKGYVRNVNLRGAPYDFRKAPYENKQWFIDMKNLIEETYNNNGKKRVILIAHSFGGPMTLTFLQGQDQKWKDTYVAGFITLAGAYGGTVKSVKMYTLGDDLASKYIDAMVQRSFQITWSSLAYLMPSPLVFDPKEPLARAFNIDFSLSNIEFFFRNLSCPDCYEMWKDSEPYKDRLAPPGVEVYCLHGSGIDTIDELTQEVNDKPNQVQIWTSDGDGTINRVSLEACARWDRKQTQAFYHEVYPKVDHMQIMGNNNPTMVNRIIAIVNEIANHTAT